MASLVATIRRASTNASENIICIVVIFHKTTSAARTRSFTYLRPRNPIRVAYIPGVLHLHLADRPIEEPVRGSHAHQQPSQEEES
jgi:hypothetical protein